MNNQRRDPLYPLAGKRIWIAGHAGMVGSAIARRLAGTDCEIVAPPAGRIDLRRQDVVEDWLADARPQAVFLAAAKVGGIHANNSLPADFLYDNLLIASNIIHASHRVGVEKLMFLGSSCIYPKFAEQPMVEEALLSGPLEPTNESYAIAKIAGIRLCQAYRRQHGSDFISVMPTNLYGIGDNFDPMSGHVIPALMLKAHRARLANESGFEVWGSGEPKREFLFVDDLADACVYLMQHYSDEMHLNVGVGRDIAIRELAALIMQTVGLAGELRFDTSKPDGTPRKLLDVSRLQALGWEAKTGLREGLQKTYAWFLENEDNPAAIRMRSV